MIRHATLPAHSQEWLHADHLTGHDLFPILQHTRLRVTSWSMFPTIRKGDRIEIDQACEVRAGDIVVYRQGGALVCHRVKDLGADGQVVTGSDDSDTGTDAVGRHDIIGRVASIIRDHRHFPPTDPAPPTPIAVLHRRLDRWRTHVWETTRASILTILTALKRRPIPRRLFTRMFLACLRFHITARMPIESIPAYDVTHSLASSQGTRRTRALVREIGSEQQLIVQAHLGPYFVGSVDLHSGEQRVHPSMCGLGLELYFADLMQQRAVQI